MSSGTAQGAAYEEACQKFGLFTLKMFENAVVRCTSGSCRVPLGRGLSRLNQRVLDAELPQIMDTPNGKAHLVTCALGANFVFELSSRLTFRW